jgi:hypothetical protein
MVLIDAGYSVPARSRLDQRQSDKRLLSYNILRTNRHLPPGVRHQIRHGALYRGTNPWIFRRKRPGGPCAILAGNRRSAQQDDAIRQKAGQLAHRLAFDSKCSRNAGRPGIDL